MNDRKVQRILIPLFLFLTVVVITIIGILFANKSDNQQSNSIKHVEPTNIKDSTDSKMSATFTQEIVYIDNFSDFQNIEDLINYEDFKNHVLFIDIWTVYCGPCLKEFQQSKDLKERYKDKPVKFIYLVDIINTAEYIDRWDSLINQYELYGYHMQMSKKFYNNINLINGIDFVGKPHYLLVDKRGNIVNPNAERPSSKEKLYNQIDRLL